MALQCLQGFSQEKSLESLKLLGEVQALNPSIHYVDLQENQLRIFQVVDHKELIQIAVVAKTPEAMQEGSDTVLKLMRSSP